MKRIAKTFSSASIVRIGLLALPLVVGCAGTSRVHVFKPESEVAQARRESMVGRWFGESATKDGGSIQHIVDRRADGTYQVWFRIREAGGRLSQQSEVGFWGVSGSIYFTMTRGWVGKEGIRPVDSRDPTFDDAYEILAASDEEIRYKSVELGDEYVVRRVADEFFFPALAGI